MEREHKTTQQAISAQRALELEVDMLKNAKGQAEDKVASLSR
jgi:hypothetical protein